MPNRASAITTVQRPSAAERESGNCEKALAPALAATEQTKEPTMATIDPSAIEMPPTQPIDMPVLILDLLKQPPPAPH
jgi:hypothetical protein